MRHLQASIAIVNLRLEKLAKRTCGGRIGDIGGEDWADCGGKMVKCRIEMIICLVAAIALLEVYRPSTFFPPFPVFVLTKPFKLDY